MFSFNGSRTRRSMWTAIYHRAFGWVKKHRNPVNDLHRRQITVETHTMTVICESLTPLVPKMCSRSGSGTNRGSRNPEQSTDQHRVLKGVSNEVQSEDVVFCNGCGSSDTGSHSSCRGTFYNGLEFVQSVESPGG